MSHYWDQVDAVADALYEVHSAPVGDELDQAATALDAACRALVGSVTLRYHQRPAGITSQRVNKIPVRDAEGNIEKVLEVWEAQAPAGSIVEIGVPH